MRVLIDDIIYNVNRIVHPENKGSTLLICVYALDNTVFCYSVECCSDYYATNIFYEALTNGYCNLNTYKVKEITYKGQMNC